MQSVDVIFILYGVIIIAISSFGIYQPKAWVGYVEKQFIYRRERFAAGAFFFLLGVIPLFFLAKSSGFATIVAIILATIWILLSIPVLTFYDPLRQAIIALGELNENWARGLFGLDVFAGVILILVGVF